MKNIMQEPNAMMSESIAQGSDGDSPIPVSLCQQQTPTLVFLAITNTGLCCVLCFEVNEKVAIQSSAAWKKTVTTETIS